MRAQVLALALLCITPALGHGASEGDDSRDPGASMAKGLPTNWDGVYLGGAEFVSGNGYSCRGMAYRLVIVNQDVQATLTPPAGGTTGGRVFAGTMQPDGTLAMTYVAAGSSGRVDIQLSLDGDTFSGFSQSGSCRYRVTARRR